MKILTPPPRGKPASTKKKKNQLDHSSGQECIPVPESDPVPMSRRSPRLASIDSLASPLPAASKAPRKPKLVKNETENSVRQAEFEEAKRKYEQDKQEHAELMAERKRRKTAAWKAEQKAAKKPAAAAAPAATTTLALPGTGGCSASPAQGFEVQRRIELRRGASEARYEAHSNRAPGAACRSVRHLCACRLARRLWTRIKPRKLRTRFNRPPSRAQRPMFRTLNTTPPRPAPSAAAGVEATS